MSVVRVDDKDNTHTQALRKECYGSPRSAYTKERHLWFVFEKKVLSLEYTIRYWHHSSRRNHVIKLTWLVLGEDPAARSRRVEQFIAP